VARFTQPTTGDGSGLPGPQGDPGPQGNAGADGSDGLDSLFLGTWNSVTEFLAAYQGGPVGLADGDWWAFVKDNTDPNKIYVVREDPNSATGWVIDDNEHFDLPQGPQGDPGADGADGSDGAQGDPGLPGADGADGATGSQGLYYLGNYVSGNGYVANLAVVKGSDNNLYIATSSGGLGDPVGNTAEWAIFLPKGADGAQGDPGPKGDQGDPGIQGETGLTGDTGPQGEQGIQGEPGISGTTGLETWTRYSPVFQATGLTFTGSGATYPTYNSYYVKAGKLVSFVIEVDLSTVTNFGTGQYKLQLPFTPAFGFNHFSGWIWADPNVSPDTGTGHTILNADTAGVTDVLDLHYLKQSGGANSPIREGLFLQGTPVTLSTISNIYVNGTYIAQ
jgi:hypothetical protein